jgi:hypothetical protein
VKQSLPKPFSNRVEATGLEAELVSLGVELDSDESTTDQDKSGPNVLGFSVSCHCQMV